MATIQLWVDNEDSAGAWDTTGSPPYLGAQDQPTNFIGDNDRNNDSGVYSFQSSADLGTITRVDLYIYANAVAYDDFEVLLNSTQTGLYPNSI